MKNFLEKDLETIIWENFIRCAEKGLDVDQKFFQYGKGYRQLNLAPYGIADLIYIHFSAPQNSWHVLILELKRGKIDLAAYQQAKRYQTAICALLGKSRRDAGQEPVQAYFTSVLIGNEVEQNGDFVYVFNADYSCRAFTYSYDFDGIAFKEVSKEWRHVSEISLASTIELASEWAMHRDECEGQRRVYLAEIQASEERELAESIQFNGDYSKALLITPDGVLHNEDWLSLPEREEDAAQ